MDPELESTFEIIPPKSHGRKKKDDKQEVNDMEIIGDSNGSDPDSRRIELIKRAQRHQKKRGFDHEKLIFEFLAVFGFTSAMMILCLSDMVQVTFIKHPQKPKENVEKPVMFDFNTEDTFNKRVNDFMTEVKMNGRGANRPKRKLEDSALFYILSENQPIEIAFRREWVADPSFFDGVDRFIRGMEWENTFEEDLFVRGVPNFDFEFELEEMTLQTTLNDKNYNRKFLNLGRKEMIGKQHSVEYFVSGRTLIRLEKMNGKEVARTEYFLKLGDLYVYDKRGDLECTRVYYAPVIDEAVYKRVMLK
ncbi:unnamed protein product [Caenorhabditis brenneri]